MAAMRGERPAVAMPKRASTRLGATGIAGRGSLSALRHPAPWRDSIDAMMVPLVRGRRSLPLQLHCLPGECRRRRHQSAKVQPSACRKPCCVAPRRADSGRQRADGAVRLCRLERLGDFTAAGRCRRPAAKQRANSCAPWSPSIPFVKGNRPPRRSSASATGGLGRRRSVAVNEACRETRRARAKAVEPPWPSLVEELFLELLRRTVDLARPVRQD